MSIFNIMDLLDRFQKDLLSGGFVRKGERILLAVSGGLDSVVLLDFFSKSGQELELELAVVHLDHGIRGEASERDMTFVHNLAQKYELAFYGEKVDTVKFAHKHKYSLEEGARILRYQFFEAMLDLTGFSKLATAHTANDQAETVLDRLLRGSGIAGLSGIPPMRGPFIRPLLLFTRKELEQYADTNTLQHVRDFTNEELGYRRNRIRKELLPYLKREFNPNLIRTLNRTARVLNENEQFLESYVKEIFPTVVRLHKKYKIILDIERFLSYFNALKKYIIFHALEELSIPRNHLNFSKLDHTLELITSRKIGTRVALNPTCQIRIDHDGIVIKKEYKSQPKLEIDIFEDSGIQFQGFQFNWRVIDQDSFNGFSKDHNVEYFDFRQTGSHFFLRNFLPGDRFIPLNFSGHKKVSDFFTDRKIPHHIREEIPIWESEQAIMWICGYGIDDRFKVTEETREILKLEMSEADGY